MDSLDHHWISELVRDPHRMLHILDDRIVALDLADPGLLSHDARGSLVSHDVDGVFLWPEELHSELFKLV